MNLVDKIILHKRSALVFASVLALLVPLTVPAQTAGSGAGPAKPSKKPDRSQMPAINLSPIVVNGHHVPIPVALQILKTALARPWSGDPKDRDKIVCRTEPLIGTHFFYLICATNAQHFYEALETQLALIAGNVPIPMVVMNWLNQREVNPGGLHAMLAKLPPLGSSYTLQITDHGKVMSRWVFKKGELVKVWYRSKSDKKQ